MHQTTSSLLCKTAASEEQRSQVRLLAERECKTVDNRSSYGTVAFCTKL